MPAMPFGARTSADEVVADLDLTGKHLLITGANTGIGFETARALASRGARLTLGCRSEGTGRLAVQSIERAHPGAQVRLRTLDLASSANIGRFVDGVGDDPLDAIICNAGLYPGGYEETEDGLERTVGVCHFGHFALVMGLLPQLQAGAGGRVVMVSSESHHTPPKLDFDRFPLQRSNYRGFVAYGQAKLCNVLFANELTRRYAADGVFANSLHPGTLVATDIGRNSAVARALIGVLKPFTKTRSQGAATSVYCAVHPDLAGRGGAYYRDCAQGRMSRFAQQPEPAARLWKLSEAWWQRQTPGRVP